MYSSVCACECCSACRCSLEGGLSQTQPQRLHSVSMCVKERKAVTDFPVHTHLNIYAALHCYTFHTTHQEIRALSEYPLPLHFTQRQLSFGDEVILLISHHEYEEMCWLLREWRQEQSSLPAKWEWMFDEDDFVSRHIDEMFIGQMCLSVYVQTYLHSNVHVCDSRCATA